MQRIGLIILACLLFKLSYSQSKIDSLDRALKVSAGDTSRVNILISLSKSYYVSGEYDKSLKYAEEARSLSERLGFEKGLSSALINIGFVHFGRGEFTKALDNCFEALRIREGMEDEAGIAKAENTIGAIYLNQGKYPEALTHCLRALKIIEKTNDIKTLASCHGNIGNIYYLQKDHKKAEENYLKSFELFSRTNNEGDIGKALNALGNCYEGMGDFMKALNYFRQSLKINESRDDKIGIATAHSNIGLVQSNLRNYDEAIVHLNKALELHEQVGNKMGITITHVTIAETLLKQKKLDEALEHSIRSLSVANEIGSFDEIKEAEMIMSDIYEAKGDHAMALNHYKKFIAARDSVNNIANNKQIAELQLQYETEKKENENKNLIHENLIQSMEISKSRTYLFSLTGILLMVLLIALLIIRQNKLRAQQKSLILEQKLLRSQMNPHFIFNSLIAIESYIYKNEPREAGKYLSNFARLMRLILENSREEYISLSKEIQTLEHYLKLQQNRFDDSFDYTIQLNEGTDPEMIAIPPMLAQPFIENSIEHGLKNIDRKGIILVTFSLNNNELMFEVKDNGIGIERSVAINENTKKHRSMATTITMERIAILNKGKRKKIRLNIQEMKDPSGNVLGTHVSFAIPYKEV
jgi:tetratricopeptide (TPR) repeat protein